MFFVCHGHYRGQRYCGDTCRQKARRASLTRARRKYRKSVQKCPDEAVRKAARDKHAGHQAGYRDRLKTRDGPKDRDQRVRGSHLPGADSCRTMESEEAGELSMTAARPQGTAAPASSVVARSLGLRSDGAIQRVAPERCVVCGAHGLVGWIVDVRFGIRPRRVEPDGDP